MKRILRALVVCRWIAVFAALVLFSQVAGATNISLTGTYSYQQSGLYVVMNADRVTNNEFGGRSGTLRMELWAFSSPYTGSYQTGYQLATHRLGELYGGEYFYNISSGSVPAYYPPSGTWYISLIITEYTNGEWPSVDHGNFSGTLVCSSGYCSTASPSVAPAAPTNVTATAGNSSATVAFTPGALGSGTLVSYWAACGIDNAHLIYGSGSSSPITVTGLTNGTAYSCWVLTRSTVGDSLWSAASNVVTPSTGTLALTAPVYRFVNIYTGGHFFTISETEKNDVLQNKTWFRSEGVGFNAYPTQAPGTLPVYRFFNTAGQGYFYTIYESEKNNVIQNLKAFAYEGIAFYAYPTKHSGTLPIYRFQNTRASAHFFTIYENEKDTVIQNYKWFLFEGVSYYVYLRQSLY